MSEQRTTGDTAAGVTLVELMVVVAIVAILAALAIPAIGRNHEDEFNRSARALVQDLMRARTLSLARKEDHSLVVVDPGRYLVQAVWPGQKLESDKAKMPPIRELDLPQSMRIVSVKQCADYGLSAGSCTSAPFGIPAELRFIGTGEMLSCCDGNPFGGTCNRALKPMTIYLQGFKPGGTPDPRLARRIVVFQSTGHIKFF